MTRILQNRYRLKRPLGQGGFSEVWHAEDILSGLEVAIKVGLRHDEAGIQLFRKEYERTNKLSHPNIIHFLDYGVDTGEVPYIVMPYYKRGSPMQRAGQLQEAEIWRIMCDIGSALVYLHDQDILHYDLKPDNFLEDDDGNFILTDFGISVRLDQDGDLPDGLTPRDYWAPELFNFDNAPKEMPFKLSEIWAFGACLYELAQGEPPFRGQGGLQQRVLHTQGQTSIHQVVVPIPGRFSDSLFNTITWCLEFDRWLRPTAVKLEELARQYASPVGAPIPSAAPGNATGKTVPASHLGAPATVQDAGTTDVPLPKRYASSKRKPALPEPPPQTFDRRLLVAILVLVVLSVVAYFAIDHIVFQGAGEWSKNPTKSENYEPPANTIQPSPNQSVTDPALEKLPEVPTTTTQRPSRRPAPVEYTNNSSKSQSRPNNETRTPPRRSSNSSLGRPNYAGDFHIVLGPINGKQLSQDVLAELNSALIGYSFWGDPEGFDRYVIKVNLTSGFTNTDQAKFFQTEFARKYQDEENPAELTWLVIKPNR